MADKIIKVDCGCSCHCGDSIDIEIWLDDDDEFCFLSNRASVFYLKQTSFLQTIWSRLKAAWFMLIGKEYCLHEICLTWPQYNELLNKMIQVQKEHKENNNV